MLQRSRRELKFLCLLQTRRRGETVMTGASGTISKAVLPRGHDTSEQRGCVEPTSSVSSVVVGTTATWNNHEVARDKRTLQTGLNAVSKKKAYPTPVTSGRCH